MNEGRPYTMALRMIAGEKFIDEWVDCDICVIKEDFEEK